MNDERILCAAIWFKDLELKRPEVLEPRGYRPYNVDRGVVLSGWRHPSCMYQMVAIYGKKMHEVGEKVQGFLTSNNRFVDREEAANVAMLAGQIYDLKFSNTKLYSEDLY